MTLGRSLLMLSALALLAGDPTDPISVTFPFKLTDGHGYRWDIGPNGGIGDGSNDAYDGGVILRLNGVSFPNQTTGRLVGGREVILGPVEMASIQVTRRIFIPEKEGYARFIEELENTTERTVRVQLSVISQLGGRIGTLQTSQPNESEGTGIIAFVTDDGDPSGSDPAILHVLGARGGPLTPTIEGRLGERVIRYTFEEIVIPSNRKVLFIHAEAQRKSAAEAIAEMERFEFHDLVADLKPAAAVDFLNFRVPYHLPHDVDVPREADRDVLTLRDGDAIYGEAQNPIYSALTDFGPREIPGEHLVAIVGNDRLGRSRLYLKSGEVYRARMPDFVLEFHLPSGHSLEIPGDRIASVGFRKREGETRGFELTGQVATLLSGDRLVGAILDEHLSLRTMYGKIVLPTARIARLQRTREDPGFYRVVLRDGSVLRGLLEEETVGFRASDGREVSIRSDLIFDLCLADSELRGDGPRVVLVTGDDFVGRIADAAITIETPFARIELIPSQIRRLEAIEGSHGEFRAVLWDETTVSGEIRNEKISIQLRAGEKFSIQAPLLSEVTNPYPELPDPIRTRVEHLISELGAPDFERREAAERDLIQLGRPAIGLLLGVSDSGDPEVRQRVQRILEVIS